MLKVWVAQQNSNQFLIKWSLKKMSSSNSQRPCLMRREIWLILVYSTKIKRLWLTMMTLRTSLIWFRSSLIRFLKISSFFKDPRQTVLSRDWDQSPFKRELLLALPNYLPWTKPLESSAHQTLWLRRPRIVSLNQYLILKRLPPSIPSSKQQTWLETCPN